MKNFLFLIVLATLTSFNSVENILPNGTYEAVIDKEYDALGFKFNINDNKFYLLNNGKTEEYDIIWEAKNRVRVVGYLEPVKYPELFNGEEVYGYYEVEKINENTYSFKVKLIDDDYALFAGKFIKQ